MNNANGYFSYPSRIDSEITSLLGVPSGSIYAQLVVWRYTLWDSYPGALPNSLKPGWGMTDGSWAWMGVSSAAIYADPWSGKPYVPKFESM